MDKSKDESALGEAAQWCARLSAPDCSDREQAACARWRAKSPVNEAAFRQVSRTAMQIDIALTTDERWALLAERALQMPAAPKAASARSTWAMAAGVMAVAVSAWIVFSWYSGHDAATTAYILNAPGKSARTVKLDDGSVVHIDAGSQISVAIDERERRIELLSGRALFEVARDRQRPFIVSANGTRTTALGTQFEVVRTDSQIVVTLVEGSISVSDRSETWRERLIPGEQLRIAGASGDHVRYSVDVRKVTGWSRGWLVYRDTPLEQVLNEINRYSEKQVRLADPLLAELEVAGSFIAGDSQSIVNAIAEILPIRAVDGGSKEIILFRRYDY